MSSKVKVADVTIMFSDGESKTLSVQHATDLMRELSLLFGTASDRTYNPPYVPMPVYIEREKWPRWEDRPSVPYPSTTPTVWCVSE